MPELPPDLPGEPPPPAAPLAVSAPAPLRVVHIDEDFVAVSKPSGLLVHRDEHYPDAPAALQTVRDQL
ncbi:MAG: tRNA pseudouridine(65) synthase TruC, partial [Planctomycetes bacterium]|nr:tRNA pseudouridine(65) synthase TruC [Planctomycetota bacterium]